VLKVWNWKCKVGNGDQSYHEQISELEKMGAMRVLQETAGAVGSLVFRGQITTLQHSSTPPPPPQCVLFLCGCYFGGSKPNQIQIPKQKKKSTNMNQLMTYDTKLAPNKWNSSWNQPWTKAHLSWTGNEINSSVNQDMHQ
jgi:hypothetical protein